MADSLNETRLFHPRVCKECHYRARSMDQPRCDVCLGRFAGCRMCGLTRYAGDFVRSSDTEEFFRGCPHSQDRRCELASTCRPCLVEGSLVDWRDVHSACVEDCDRRGLEIQHELLQYSECPHCHTRDLFSRRPRNLPHRADSSSSVVSYCCGNGAFVLKEPPIENPLRHLIETTFQQHGKTPSAEDFVEVNSAVALIGLRCLDDGTLKREDFAGDTKIKGSYKYMMRNSTTTPLKLLWNIARGRTGGSDGCITQAAYACLHWLVTNNTSYRNVVRGMQNLELDDALLEADECPDLYFLFDREVSTVHTALSAEDDRIDAFIGAEHILVRPESLQFYQNGQLFQKSLAALELANPVMFPYGLSWPEDCVFTTDRIQAWSAQAFVRDLFRLRDPVFRLLKQRFQINLWLMIEEAIIDDDTDNHRAAINAGNRPKNSPVPISDSLEGSYRNVSAYRRLLRHVLRERGSPDVFITLTINPNTEDLLLVEGDEDYEFHLDAQDEPYRVSLLFRQKVDAFAAELNRFFPKGLKYSWKAVEFQRRGLPHCHMLLWSEEGTYTLGQLNEFVRVGIADIQNARAHKVLHENNFHNCYTKTGLPRDCIKGKPFCWRRFPQLAECSTHGSLIDGHYKPPRTAEQGYEVTFSPGMSCLWSGHCCTVGTAGARKIMYCCKYCSKDDETKYVSIKEGPGSVVARMKLRTFSSTEACFRLSSPGLRAQDLYMLRGHDGAYEYDPVLKYPLNSVKWFQPGPPPSDYDDMLRRYLARPKNFEFALPFTEFFSRYSVRKVCVGSAISDDDFLIDDAYYKIAPLRHRRLVIVEQQNGVPSRLPVAKGECHSSAPSDSDHGDSQDWALIFALYNCVFYGENFEKEEILNMATCAGFRDCSSDISSFISEVVELNWMTRKEALLQALSLHSDIPGLRRAVQDHAGPDHWLLMLEAFARGAPRERIEAAFQQDMGPEANGTPKAMREYEDYFTEIKGAGWRRVATQLMDQIKNYPQQIHLMRECLATILSQLCPNSTVASSIRALVPANWLIATHLQSRSSILVVDAPGGIGKSVIIKLLLSLFRESRLIALLGSVSSQAARVYGDSVVLLDRSTLHKLFGLDILGNFHTVERPLIKDASLIIIDEVFLAHREWLAAADTMCREATGKHDCAFGGLTLICFGDSGQIVPVVHGRCQEEDREALLRTHHAYAYFEEAEADVARPTESEILKPPRFANQEWTDELLEIRDGRKDRISLSEYETCHKLDLDAVARDGTPVFAPVHAEVMDLNEKIADKWASQNHQPLRWVTGCEVTPDRAWDLTEDELDEIQAARLPPLRLPLAVGMPVKFACDYGNIERHARATVVALHQHAVSVRLAASGCVVPISRKLFGYQHYGEARWRLQFPLQNVFAQTFHSVQGLTLETPYYISLQHGVIWEHGQLYVLLSRAKSKNLVRFLVDPAQSHVINVVYKKLLAP